MLRMVSAVLVSGALAFGGLNPASAQPGSEKQITSVQARPPAPAVNGPLAPGEAAGVKQAQAQGRGIRNFIPLAIVTGLAILVVVTGGDDDDSTTTTTGTN